MRRGVPVLLALCGASYAWCETPWQDELAFDGRRVTITRTPLSDSLTSYRFELNDGGSRRERVVQEQAGESLVRTGNALFDGLYALALEEARQNSVAQIQDSAFHGGQPIPCECFQTGEKWPYVWTRDISYSVDLALGHLDPLRARNSLLFKQSGVRPALTVQGVPALQVVAQDTGSGGSWPVSTDRVVWIHAAMNTLRHLPVPAARTFELQARRVAVDTLAQERQYAWDPHVGLYRGETSFLDWREQTYPHWTQNDTLYIAESYSFSTNVLHYIALRDAALLARHAGDAAQAAGYERFARKLKTALNQRFWQEQAGMYVSYLGNGLNPAPVQAYDLLGLALAIIHGVADERQARLILKNYPLTLAGPPVIWPEQQDIAIYHNRAIWPFVTAYALQAAKRAQHTELATHLAESLMRGAALSLSNMENFEFLTQRIAIEDGGLSGPVVNSPRQLWSIAGYLNMVEETLFGLTVDSAAVRIEPFLPGRLAHAWFAGQKEIALNAWHQAGATLNVVLHLPPDWNEVDQLLANASLVIPLKELASGSPRTVNVTLIARPAPQQPLKVLAVGDPHSLTAGERRSLFAPHPPQLAAAQLTPSQVQLQFQGVEVNSALQIYRNGARLAANVRDESYTDRSSVTRGLLCYFATQQYLETKLVSLPSRELCLPAADFTYQYLPTDGTLISPDRHAIALLNGRAQFASWGGPSQELRLVFAATSAGRHRLRVEYANAHGPINTGITAAQKRVVAKCSGMPVQQGSIVMPHLARWTTYGWSSSFVFSTRRGHPCEISVRDGFNMSYLQHFAAYTGGLGGASGALNRANIAAAQIDLLEQR